MSTEIIAEIGINFGGSMSLAKDMINKVQASGADVVKFQLYDPHVLLRRKWFSAEDWDCICESELTRQQTEMLAQYCADIKIEFMASAFDTSRLLWLEYMDVKRHKIASRSIFDINYVNSVKRTEKPYLVSLGWLQDSMYSIDPRMVEQYEKEEEEADETVTETLTRLGRDIPNATLLYCIAKYPCTMRDLYGMPEYFGDQLASGFSDHSEGITAAQVAIARGATIVEKHFTLDKKAKGPDHAGSMDLDELVRLCKFRDAVSEMS